jgi:hypothetical protein
MSIPPNSPVPVEDPSGHPDSIGHWIDSVVRIYIDGSGYFQGILVEVTASGIVVDFPLDVAPDLPVSKEVKIALSTDRLASSLNTPALVVYKGEDEYRCRYRFEISSEARVALTVLIDGRSVYRAPPDPLHPVPVLLWNEGQETSIEGILNDSSRTGLSVFVRAEDGPRLSEGARIGMRVQLPGDQKPIQLWGSLRHQQVAGWATRVGIEFEQLGPAEFSDDQERFVGYVMNRQVQILRQFSPPREPAR